MRALVYAIFAIGLVAIGAVGGWFYARERLPFQRPPKEAVVVIDGDTIKLGTQLLRVLNLDAPETRRARCDGERALGNKATQALTTKVDEGLKAGTLAIFPDGTFDRYRRPRVRVEVNGKDIADEMIAGGYARPWQGRTSDWCAQLPGN